MLKIGTMKKKKNRDNVLVVGTLYYLFNFSIISKLFGNKVY